MRPQKKKKNKRHYVTERKQTNFVDQVAGKLNYEIVTSIRQSIINVIADPLPNNWPYQNPNIDLKIEDLKGTFSQSVRKEKLEGRICLRTSKFRSKVHPWLLVRCSAQISLKAKLSCFQNRLCCLMMLWLFKYIFLKALLKFASVI